MSVILHVCNKYFLNLVFQPFWVVPLLRIPLSATKPAVPFSFNNSVIKYVANPIELLMVDLLLAFK